MENHRKVIGLVFLFVLLISSSAVTQNWTPLGLQNKNVTAIDFHPSAIDTVFATVRDTIFRSIDGGATFSRVFVNPAANRDFTDIVIAPSNPTTIVASDEGNALGSNAKFFTSSDGGRSWVGAPAIESTINDISVDPSNPAIGFLATTTGLFRNLVKIDTLSCKSVAHDPNNASVLYEGIGATTGVGKSTDGGGTWTYSGTGINLQNNLNITGIVVDPENGQNVFCIGWWREFVGTDGDVYKSLDGGTTWTGMGLGRGDLNDISLDTVENFVFVGGNNGIWIIPENGGIVTDLKGDLPGNIVRSLAIVEGEKVIVGTNKGVFALTYLPNLIASAKQVSETSGDNDGIPEPGETVDLAVGLFNSLFSGTGISATLRVIDDPTVTVTKGTANYPDIPALSYGDNGADPFVLEIDATADTHFVELEIEVTASGGAYSATDTISLMIGMPTILLVDDDGGAAFDTFYTNTLDSLGFAFDVWNPGDMGAPTNLLQRPTLYHAAIWMSGNAENDILTMDDINALTDYLNTGGRLIMTGQNIVEDLDDRGDPGGFLSNVLHIGLADPSATGRILFGEDGDVLGDQIERALISGGNGANNQTSPDVLSIEPDSLAKPFLTYVTPVNGPGAVHMEDVMTAARAIVLGFGFEAVNRTNPTDTATVTRGELMSIMLDLLQPGVGIGDGGGSGDVGLPKTFALGQNYPNPFNPSTTIEFVVPEGREATEFVSLKIYNLRGQLVKTLVDDTRESGSYVVRWDGKTENGADVGSGVYLYRLSVGDRVAARKMVLLK